MNKFSRLLILVTALSVLVLTPACACTPSAGTTTTVNNAVTTAQQVEIVANTVISDAQIAWAVISPALPAATAAQAQADFAAGLFAAQKAVLVLADAIQGAQAVNTANPDFTAAMQAVTDAIGQIVAIVNNFKSLQPATVTAHSAHDNLSQGLSTLKKTAGAK
jgi:hypothetical protein